MRNPFSAVSEKNIRDWVGPRSFQLGRSYFEDGAILDPRLQGSTLRASCQGSRSQPYRLWVVYGTEGIEEAHCSCPVGGGGRCKHVGALLLAWLDQPDAFRAVEELDANLEQCSQSELIALIKQMLQVQPDLETLLELALSGSGRDRTTLNPDSYRRQIASAFRNAGNDWQAARRVEADIDLAMGTGAGFLDNADYANACIVYQAVHQGLMEHYEMMLDNADYLWDVMNQCTDGLGDCLGAADGDVAVRERALQALFAMYRFNLDIGGYGFGDDPEAFMLELTTDEEKNTIAGWVRTAMQTATGPYDDHKRRAYSGLLLALEADLDDDAFLEICRENGRWADLVDRLLVLERLGEALAEAERAGDSDLLTLAGVFRQHGYDRRLESLVIKRIETTHNHGLTAWLKDRYEERGELDEALVLAHRMLEQRPDLAGYRNVRDLSQRLGNWYQSRSKLLAEWAAARQYGLLTDVHLEEGAIGPALKAVRQYEQISPYARDRLLRVAQAAAETHPQASIDIYRDQAERLVEARGRDNYRQACNYLTKIQGLYRQMSQKPAWTDFMAGFRERHRGLPALQNELDKEGL